MVLGTLILGETEESMRTKVLAVGMAVAASFAMADDVNHNIWFDGTEPFLRVDACSGHEYVDCETESYWYDIDDRKNDRGGSYALYPYDTTGYNGSLIAPMIDSLGYLVIKYYLEDPAITGQSEEYPYNFVKFGFNIVQMGDPGLDISSTGGLCATYTSDMEVWLEVITDKTGNTPCFAKLPKAVEPTTVDKAIEDFAQPSWAADSNKVASCMEAFKAARSVMFKLDGGASVMEGALRIFEVGPKGTCKGGKSIVDECWSYCKSDGDGHAVCRGRDRCGVSNLRKSVWAASHSVTVNGRIVSLNGLGRTAQYKLFDMQGNVVRSGYAAGRIDFGGVKSGSYLLKVKGNLELTEKIVLK